MSLLMKNSMALRPRVASRSVRSVRVFASAADRPLWYPGNPAPAYLDGSLAGDYGFDPLGLGSDSDNLRWYVQAELIHCRWAMLGTAGILLTALGAEAGLGFPQWYDAGKVTLQNTGIPFGSLLLSTFLCMAWVEMKRFMDFKNPGSQGDGSFFGITDDFKGKENAYPGGRYFDPFGMSRGDVAVYKKYKQHEIVNGRLAMVAQVGFWSQYAATGKGPIQNLQAHLADPAHVTFATNGVSVPFL